MNPFDERLTELAYKVDKMIEELSREYDIDVLTLSSVVAGRFARISIDLDQGEHYIRLMKATTEHTQNYINKTPVVAH